MRTGSGDSTTIVPDRAMNDLTPFRQDVSLSVCLRLSPLSESVCVMICRPVERLTTNRVLEFMHYAGGYKRR